MSYVVSQLTNKSKWKNAPPTSLYWSSSVVIPVSSSHLPLAIIAAQRKGQEPGVCLQADGVELGPGASLPLCAGGFSCSVITSGDLLRLAATLLSHLWFPEQSAEPWGKKGSDFLSHESPWCRNLLAWRKERDGVGCNTNDPPWPRDYSVNENVVKPGLPRRVRNNLPTSLCSWGAALSQCLQETPKFLVYVWEEGCIYSVYAGWNVLFSFFATTEKGKEGLVKFQCS